MVTEEHIENRKQVLRFTETNPEYHNQGEYICGTQACIAGTALLFDHFGTEDAVTSILRNGDAFLDVFPDWDRDDNFWEFERARDILGLSEATAQELFYCMSESRAIEMLRVLCEELPGVA